jgi:flavin-dependent dehydrogenase
MIQTPHAPDATSTQHDAVILGGGLAGLSLALQLKQRLPALNVLVLERRSHPVPVAAHKVGESTVEIGAHYFSAVLGLKEHLQHKQLKKFGFRFFFSDRERQLAAVTELGASTFLPTPAYQLDRGIFENALARFAQERGVRFLDRALVRDFTLRGDGGTHGVTYEHEGSTYNVKARWLVDATGRAGLIKRRRHLAVPNEHDANAVWFRIASRIDVDDWSDDESWLERCDPPHRWLSTIHLVGDGYWVWLIPLASGSHSVGIVADAGLHPLDGMNTFDKAMKWLERHQPRLYDALDTKRRGAAGFCVLPRFLLRVQTSILRRRALGAHRRGRIISRSVLFARQRFHCHRQHVHHGTDSARPRGRTGRHVRRRLSEDLPLAV